MSSERESIGTLITDYLEGMIYGQTDRLNRAMHPLCMQAGHFGGQYEFCNRYAFIESLQSAVMEAPGTPYKAQIVTIDITGDVAVAKVTDDCFGTSFTDYLTLIKHDGKWQIVMKAFFDHANAAKD
ncbi:nuclear transport factor 2 family protein [Aestuariivirga sp.]|uniref:nuclear transport factor 2 family protein n=1 Tax=Aestuariivirga sp. TaxID=2650926 RepID=UPI003593BF6C